MLFPSIAHYIKLNNVELITFLNNNGSRTVCENKTCQNALFLKRKKGYFNLPKLEDIPFIRNSTLISKESINSSTIQNNLPIINPTIEVLPNQNKRKKSNVKNKEQLQKKTNDHDLISRENILQNLNNDINFDDLFGDINNLVPNDFNVDNILMNVDNMNDEPIDFLCHENLNNYL